MQVGILAGSFVGAVAGIAILGPGGITHRMIVFESEDAAQAVADNVNAPPNDVVTIESVGVEEVVAHA